MTYLIAYVAKTPVKNRHLNYVSHVPVTEAQLDAVRETLAFDATRQLSEPFDPEDITITNVIFMPDDTAPLQAS